MSHTIIYGYFRNKQSLFEALKIEMLKILRQMMTDCSPSAPMAQI